MKGRTKRGFTLPELIIGSSISLIVMLGTVSTLLMGLMVWTRGAARLDANTYARRAVRAMSMELRQAYSVTVDSNGQGVTFYRPAVDATKTIIQPLVSDNIPRRFYYNSDAKAIDYSVNGQFARRIARGISLTDPSNGNAAYPLFTAGAGATTRSVTLYIVSSQNQYRSETVYGRSRESLYLRNVPQLTH